MLLETKDLKKHFKKVKAVDGVDLSVTEGECLGLFGTKRRRESRLPFR